MTENIAEVCPDGSVILKGLQIWLETLLLARLALKLHLHISLHQEVA